MTQERDRTWPPKVLHISELSLMSLSPAHFRAAYLDPREQTAAMRYGSLDHALVLGGDYVVYDGERKGNAWKDFETEHKGKLIVTKKEFTKATRAAAALRSDPLCSPFLEGEKEVYLEWDLYGRRCGGTVDVLHPSRIVDLKKARCAEPYRFGRTAISMNYHAKMAWYVDAARANKYDVNEAWIIAHEIEPPYAAAPLRITDRALDAGRGLVRLWMESFERCLAADQWPGYVQVPGEIDIPDDSEELGLVFGDEDEAAA
jgi:hypothetical protein